MLNPLACQAKCPPFLQLGDLLAHLLLATAEEVGDLSDGRVASNAVLEIEQVHLGSMLAFVQVGFAVVHHWALR
jgi:hypothetical protein